MYFDVSCSTANSLLHEPRRHAYRLRDLRRRSASRVGPALGPSPRIRLGQPGLASLAIAADAAHHTLIRYDWRGCGLSDREGVGFSLEKHIEDLEAVVRGRRVEAFRAVCMSGGGSARDGVRAFAIRSRSRRLVLYGCPSAGPLARGETAERSAEAADPAQSDRARLVAGNSGVRQVLCHAAYSRRQRRAISFVQ